MRPDIVPGAVFPDYELPDHRGKHRSLSELQGGDPLVLVLSRGSFCPKDRRQHEGLVQLHREMQVGYCRLVTISTDNLLEPEKAFRFSARALDASTLEVSFAIADGYYLYRDRFKFSAEGSPGASNVNANPHTPGMRRRGMRPRYVPRRVSSSCTTRVPMSIVSMPTVAATAAPVTRRPDRRNRTTTAFAFAARLGVMRTWTA